MRNLKNIIFDFGAVLVDLDKHRCIEAFRNIGADDIAGYVDECRQEDLFHDLEVGNIGIGEFCDEVRRKCPGCKATDDAICEAWNALLAGIPKWRLMRLLMLKKDYRLFLLSNTNPIHWHKAVADYFPLNGLGVDDYFEKTYLSYKMHLLKPDREIFEAVLADAGIKAEETLFIDDSDANCEAARQLGIKAYNPKKKRTPLSDGSKQAPTPVTEGKTEPCVATIGFFDGVHKGHRMLIKSIVEEAAKTPGMRSTVISFDQHPRRVLNKEFQPALLTTNDEKLGLLSKTGVDSCVLLPFDLNMAAMSAREFMQTVLHDRLGVRKLIIGYDHRFGHNRAEGFEDYVRYGREIGIEVSKAGAFEIDGVNVSSSVIRSFLSEGEVELARTCLGYNYFITGSVVSGYHEGRKMGFPTANIEVDDKLKLIPAPGVYAVKVCPAGSGRVFGGMMNIGTRPTFNGSDVTLEVNIFDFEGDLYGQSVTVSFVSRLRSERKFSSAEQLAKQLNKDREEAEKELRVKSEE